jgi:hypothetical protein
MSVLDGSAAPVTGPTALLGVRPLQLSLSWVLKWCTGTVPSQGPLS